MKVHRIITTIEVENDNSITSIELTKLYPASDCILLAITNMTTNGNADDITKVYDSVNKSRLGIAGKLKGIARIINDSLDDYECGIIGRDYNDGECNDETKADKKRLSMLGTIRPSVRDSRMTRLRAIWLGT